MILVETNAHVFCTAHQYTFFVQQMQCFK